ncbi:myb/SANT-like domain, Harbinger transposase-derived nuclease domain protein [Artemisia annua]|uniref:Myb/SANT-like domain, Harbinger transposase-derived nuclease domain protein n=1 Tax=Artemisia annua TaxID=35608 RepID=A0A2U1LJX9_ARTAN|nr:myb/SANT-like domain, Harbinger transposase-derived nuclease domain protein [Artemisia annua]
MSKEFQIITEHSCLLSKNIPLCSLRMGDPGEKLNFTAEQLKLGRNGGSLHVDSWKKVAQALEDTYGIKTTQKKLKNKFDYYKGKYHLWANLKGKTGNVYNSQTNSFNFTEEEWRDLNVKTNNKANNLRNSPLLYPHLCADLYEKCAATGPKRQVFGKRNRTPPSSSLNPVNQVLQIEDVPNDEGGSPVPPPTNENCNVDFDTEYDNSFESGTPVPPPTSPSRVKSPSRGKSPSRVRPKKKAKGGISEFEEDMKQAIINMAKGGFSKNKGPSADECHEKLKVLELESSDPLYLTAFLIFSQPGGNYRDTWMTLPSNPNVLKGYIQKVGKQLGLI